MVVYKFNISFILCRRIFIRRMAPCYIFSVHTSLVLWGAVRYYEWGARPCAWMCEGMPLEVLGRRGLDCRRAFHAEGPTTLSNLVTLLLRSSTPSCLYLLVQAAIRAPQRSPLITLSIFPPHLVRRSSSRFQLLFHLLAATSHLQSRTLLHEMDPEAQI